ncbi:MAG: hypothetical protein VB125_04110 [Burkholderia sp.]
MMMLTNIERFWHEQFSLTLPDQALAGAGVHFPGDVVEFDLGEHGQVRTIGHVLTQQPVGGLVTSVLPGCGSAK